MLGVFRKPLGTPTEWCTRCKLPDLDALRTLSLMSLWRLSIAEVLHIKGLSDVSLIALCLFAVGWRHAYKRTTKIAATEELVDDRQVGDSARVLVGSDDVDGCRWLFDVASRIA